MQEGKLRPILQIVSLILWTDPATSPPPPQYLLSIYSNGTSFSEPKSLGHAFMVIKVKSSFGYKEEAIGFHSDPLAQGAADLPKLTIGMKGALRNEFNMRVDRFQKVEESLDVSITGDQRRAIYSTISKWNTHHYSLLQDNCIKFIGEVAAQLGIPSPSPALNPTSNAFVRALRENYHAELAKRRAEEEARRRAEEQARRRAEEQARRRAEEAKTVPAGWVACTCPSQHASSGRFFNGTLFHPVGISCN